MREVISDVGRTHLRWALTPGVGPIVFGHLIERFGDAEQALGASAAEFERVPKVGRKKAEAIARGVDAVELDGEIAAAAEHGVRIVCQADEEYPLALRRIADPPIVIYVKGTLPATDAVALAIVGTRRCSMYGSEQARRFGELLAQVGFTVVSGLARGVDAFAHHGAVDVGGRSIGVLGNALREIYPPENASLAEKMLEKGALISELPMAANVDRGNFPNRNRIIAGLTLGTLVIEAPTRSGALITARLAAEYNREVFALPGRCDDGNSLGTNKLIRDGGAKLVLDLQDILDELGEVGYLMMPKPGADPDTAPQQSTPKSAGQLSIVESQVLGAVGYEPLLTQTIASATGLAIGEVLGALTSLELKRLVRRLPGQMVVRAGKA